MKNKGTLASLAVIIVLAGYIVVRDWKCQDRPSAGTWKGEPTEIIIQKPSETLVLKFSEGKWLLGDDAYPADGAEITAIIRKVKEVEIVDRVSSGANYALYDLTPDKAVAVTVKSNGEQLRKLLVGKTSSTRRHTYMRVNDSADVMLVSGSFDYEFGKSIDDLRDRTVVNIARDKVDGIVFKYKGRNISFVKDKASATGEPQKQQARDLKEPAGSSDRWKIAGPGEKRVKPESMDSLLSVLSPLKAVGFMQNDKTRLKNPLGTVIITENGRNIVLSLYQVNADKRYPITSSDSPYVFLADEWKIKKLLIDKADEYIEK